MDFKMDFKIEGAGSYGGNNDNNSSLGQLGMQDYDYTDANSSFGSVPVSILPEMNGGSRQLFYSQNESESHFSDSIPAPQQNLRYAIDNSTGNLLIIQDGNSGASQVPCPSGLSLSGDALALLQILDDGISVEDAPSQRLTFHSAEDYENSSDNEQELSQLYKFSRLICNTDEQALQVDEAPLRRALWSRKKIHDFLECIHIHEQRFQKASKIKKGNIWNDISKDMLKLGYLDCNKDECNKKWNNLYRTWKKVKLRSKEDRHKWQYYHQITSLVRAITQHEKSLNSTKKPTTTQDLIFQFMEQNRKHQENIRKAEEKFQIQVLRLNTERDDILHEIQGILKN